nr:lipoyl(octanoyl) transferase LipB [Hyphomonas sp. UBA2691]|tara:strand:+ start:3019 stop:3810 length:792 start_codon:yes stop_codon:yes gene_type:complete
MTALVFIEADGPYKATPALCEALNVAYMPPVMQKFPDTEWAVSDRLVPYEDAVRFMEARARAIREDGAPELVWFLEHPPLYTSGTSAKPDDLRDPARFPVFDAGRGGQYTYHGPGQRVAYVMLDVALRGRDVRAFVQNLETWIIKALAAFNVEAGPRDGRVGVWVDRTKAGGTLREDKIAAIGVRLKKWVSFHGISLNVEPDLEHFSGITPCGIADPRYGVTSLVDLGIPAAMDDVDLALKDAFETVFESRLVRAPDPIREPA